MRFAIAAWLLLVVATVSPQAAEPENPVWKPIFDSKTFNGWIKNGQGDWTIEDGAMVGRAKMTKLYGHMVSTRRYRDFTLRFKYKCEQGDSGFFIRTEMQPPDKTIGLQVQCGPLGSGNGGIYDSYGRGWLHHPSKDDEREFYRVGQFNEMIISAHGGRVTVHVNGIKSADLDDAKIRPEGVFATQLHSGTDVIAYFKDFQILEKGKITPKEFLGLALRPITPEEDGSLSLSASAANGIGPKSVYLPERAAFGCWSDRDRVEWLIEGAQAGSYDVWMEWSVDDKHAGNPYILQIGTGTVHGNVGKTGGRDKYKYAKIGRINLKTGRQRVIVKAGGRFDTALLDLRRIRLSPANSKSKQE